MRSDVKLGFTIGGVLLAVLIVYVMVISGPPDAPDRVSLSTTDSHTTSATPSAEATVRGPAEPAKDPFADTAAEGGSPPDNAPQAAQAAPAGNDRWSAALNSGHLPVMMTQTPNAQQASPLPPVPAGANQPTAISQADSTPVAASNTPAAVNFADLIQPGTGAPASAVAGKHTVQVGESFASIAQDVYGNAAYYPHLMRANPKIDPRKLRPGMVVDVPPVSEVRADNSQSPAAGSVAATDAKTEYRVQAGDSLYKISMKLYGKGDFVDRIYELNKTTIGPDPAKLKVGMVLKLPEAPTTQ